MRRRALLYDSSSVSHLLEFVFAAVGGGGGDVDWLDNHLELASTARAASVEPGQPAHPDAK